MANVTDPLASAVHGTDPQNLMEYITRQKIYDSRFWKEECFGLTAADVLEKATLLKCYGASFGGNSQPTKFLCLILKLLQIQPPADLIDTFLDTDDFKYVRALGAFYKRLTGRPADIYRALEPMYTEYCKLRYRDVTEWKLITMDQFVHQLLHEDRVCGISLPRLAARESLVEEGYLETNYESPILQVVGNQSLGEYLYQKVQDGSPAAKLLWDERESRRKAKDEENRQGQEAIEKATAGDPRRNSSDMMHRSSGDERHHSEANGEKFDRNIDRDHYDQDYSRSESIHDISKPPESKRARKDKKKEYGGLFKSSSTKQEKRIVEEERPTKISENSDEYWNEERAKLGLKPLRK